MRKAFAFEPIYIVARYLLEISNHERAGTGTPLLVLRTAGSR